MAAMRTRASLLACFAALLVAALIEFPVFSQRPQGDREQRFAEMSAEREREGLAETFVGVTTNGRVRDGLFEIRSTGVTTAPVRQAADAFLAALTPDQRDRTTRPVDDPEWRKWMNQHFYVRDGVSFEEMDDAQREAAFDLLRAALSAEGFALSRNIMKLNHTLAELTGNFDEYGEWLYHLTVMGEPSEDAPWGFQLDGHHLILNYFVLGDQVVMTPAFFGSEPVIAPTGTYEGVAILQKEQELAEELMAALTPEQREAAVIQEDKPGNNNLTEAWQDNAVVPYEGVRADALDGEQRQKLLALIGQYVGAMDEGHARVKMAQVERYLDETYLAWVGDTEPGGVFYYRVHSPVILIEFDHQRPIALDGPRVPSRRHIHAVVRTPNGNDYGKDLLRQHLVRAHGGA